MGEVHRRDVFGEPPCKYEFGQCVLARIKEPLTKFSPRMQRVIFLGFAPDVTNGYFVMRPDHKIELTSNIADDTIFDEPPDVLEQPVEKVQEQPQHQKEPYTDKELEAVMGFEGGEGWMWGEDANRDLYFGPQDDPMAVVSRTNAHKANITRNCGINNRFNRRRYRLNFRRRSKNLVRCPWLCEMFDRVLAKIANNGFWRWNQNYNL